MGLGMGIPAFMNPNRELPQRVGEGITIELDDNDVQRLLSNQKISISASDIGLRGASSIDLTPRESSDLLMIGDAIDVPLTPDEIVRLQGKDAVIKQVPETIHRTLGTVVVKTV